MDIVGTDGLDELRMELECRITLQSQELFSFYCVGEASIDNESKPYEEFDPMTLDMKNVKELKLSDFVDIDETLVERIKSSTDVTNRAVESGMDKKNLLYQIQNKDTERYIENLTKGWSGFVLEPDALVIETLVTYASGVYALIRLPGRIVDNRFIFDESPVTESGEK